ncbi:MAG: phosphoglucosamine mutase [Clostridia bacterium]|nr:phosphoglucosamine mutase [Clostridia bacterium]
MGKLFGTDGVRGIANRELTCDLAFKIGQAGAYVLTKAAHGKPKLVVGKDTRISGDMLESALIAGFCSVGASAIKLGVIPTPAVAYLTRMYKADAGVVISASHNPMEYNGIKFFNSEGFKLSDSIEEEIEDIVLNGKFDLIKKCEGDKVGKVTREENGLVDYVRFVKSTVDCNFEGMKIAVDCANGATYLTAGKALAGTGASLLVFNNYPDGGNINKMCGSTYPDGLCSMVKGTKFDAGIAFDGDGDRMIAVDENGEVVDGDVVMAICAEYMLKEGKLKNDMLVATVMSNLGLTLAGEKYGYTVKQTAVGDRYVLEEMIRSGANLGGEQSGHIIFLDYNTTGDGLVSAFQLLSVMKKTGKPLSILAKEAMMSLPQVIVNVKVNKEIKEKIKNDKTLAEMVKSAEESLNGCGRVLIRPSGTEPVVRVMLEGENKEVLEKEANEIATYIERKMA